MSVLHDRLADVASQTLKPQPKLTMSQWADEFAVISNLNAEPGRWKTSRVPYMKEIMDSVSDPKTREITLMFSAQTTKTSFLQNLVGYFSHQEPSPILLVQPTEGDAINFSRTKLQPMIECTPVLKKIFDPRNSTLSYKSYPGGYVAMVGGHSATSLCSRSCRIVLLDEIDRMPDDISGEGNPVDLARKRATTFRNSLVVAASTPNEAGNSKIETLYLAGTQHRYHLKCIHCSEYWYPEWDHVQWTDGNPDSALLVCPYCGGTHADYERDASSKKGIWVPENPTARHLSYHTNALCSPFAPLSKMVEEYLVKSSDPSKMQSFYNLELGLPYKYTGESVGDLALVNRAEPYTTTTLPNAIVHLTVGVDIQADRIEYCVTGFSNEGVCYNVDYGIVYGDTTYMSTYNAFRDQLFNTPYIREDGISLEPAIIFMDSGYNTVTVHEFCSANKKYNIHAVKGKSGPGQMVRESKNNKTGTWAQIIAVDLFKELLFNCLAIKDIDSPHYIHFPIARDVEFYTQLCMSETREKQVDRSGIVFWKYKKIRDRNEGLDTMVYSLAAYRVLKDGLKRNADFKIRQQLKTKEIDGVAVKSEVVEMVEPPVSDSVRAVDPVEKVVPVEKVRAKIKWL